MRNPSQAPEDETPPAALLALAAFTRRYSHDPERPEAIAVPTRTGRITLHASLPDGLARGKVAIVLERTPSPQSTSIRLEAYGVTRREREIAILLAQGSPTPRSPPDWCSPPTPSRTTSRACSRKRVSSRQELVARVFLDEYLPQLPQRTPLTSTGSFIQHPDQPK
jgi:hypothetical protein